MMNAYVNLRQIIASSQERSQSVQLSHWRVNNSIGWTNHRCTVETKQKKSFQPLSEIFQSCNVYYLCPWREDLSKLMFWASSFKLSTSTSSLTSAEAIIASAPRSSSHVYEMMHADDFISFYCSTSIQSGGSTYRERIYFHRRLHLSALFFGTLCPSFSWSLPVFIPPSFHHYLLLDRRQWWHRCALRFRDIGNVA